MSSRQWISCDICQAECGSGTELQAHKAALTIGGDTYRFDICSGCWSNVSKGLIKRIIEWFKLLGLPKKG